MLLLGIYVLFFCYMNCKFRIFVAGALLRNKAFEELSEICKEYRINKFIQFVLVIYIKQKMILENPH